MKPISKIKRTRILFGGQRSLESKSDDGTVYIQRIFTIYRLNSGKWYYRKRDILDDIKDGDSYEVFRIPVKRQYLVELLNDVEEER